MDEERKKKGTDFFSDLQLTDILCLHSIFPLRQPYTVAASPLPLSLPGSPGNVLLHKRVRQFYKLLENPEIIREGSSCPQRQLVFN